MKKLFAVNDLNQYMWNHLASTLFGDVKNQTFTVYFGSGSNGKSMLTDLMKHVFGEYKVQVPVPILTDKRSKVGAATPEIMQLRAARLGIVQELTKESRELNEGVMKEITGGDDITGRGLFADTETFKPQLSLVICTNILFKIMTNDDGTWRRIKKCDFNSKFIDVDDTTDYGNINTFIKDKELSKKIPSLAPTFASLLIEIAFKTNGIVMDCDTVNDSSKKYRFGEDYISAFIDEHIKITNNKDDILKKSILTSTYKIWYTQEYGNSKISTSEIFEKMKTKFDKQFKSLGGTGGYWEGLQITMGDDVENATENDFKN